MHRDELETQLCRPCISNLNPTNEGEARFGFLFFFFMARNPATRERGGTLHRLNRSVCIRGTVFSAAVRNGSAFSMGSQAPVEEETCSMERTSAFVANGQRLYEELPISAHRAQILSSIRKERVVCIQGETGCGKSSMVPIFITEEAVRKPLVPIPYDSVRVATTLARAPATCPLGVLA